MKVAITGGDGLLGANVARTLEARGASVVRLSRRRGVDLGDLDALRDAFAGCEAVVHAAGINRELGSQTFDRVHREGTGNVVRAAREAGVSRIVFVSFLRARPDCGSGYHESKWDAEEMVRASGLDYTVFKPGIVYGRGDHMIDHISRALRTFPVFALVGSRNLPMRPTAAADAAMAIAAACNDPRLSRKTVALLGPEEMTLRTAVGRVASALGNRARFAHVPIWVHRLLAAFFERTMVVPLAAKAQVRILSETLAEPLPRCEELPEDLRPRIRLGGEQIHEAVPDPVAFRIADFCPALRP
jgi:NADH dehydrogenase